MNSINHDDGVNVIGHHNENIDPNVGIVLDGRWEFVVGNHAGRRQHHLAIYNGAERAFLVFGADRYEIPTARAVVPAGEAGGLDSLFVLEHGHDDGS